MGSTIQCKAL